MARASEHPHPPAGTGRIIAPMASPSTRTPSTRNSSVEGRLEAAGNGTVVGWAYDAAAPGRRLEVEVLVDGDLVTTATADGFHRGLSARKIGDGHHMFRAVLPTALADGREHELAVRVAGAGGSALRAVRPFPGFTINDASPFRTTTFVVAGVPSAPPEQPLRALAEHPGVTVASAGVRSTVRGDPQGLKLHRLLIDVAGDDFALCLDAGLVLDRCKIIVRGDGCRIVLGADACVRNSILRIEGDRGRIVVGEQTTMEGGTLLVHEHDLAVDVGRDCMLSREVFVRTSDSHAIVDTSTGERVNPPAPVRLGDHVWLGAGAQVGKGVTIGDGAIVGQHAVVTADVPSETIIAGNPARVVRSGVTWRRELDGRT